jgi:hypothetical protein
VVLAAVKCGDSLASTVLNFCRPHLPFLYADSLQIIWPVTRTGPHVGQSSLKGSSSNQNDLVDRSVTFTWSVTSCLT